MTGGAGREGKPARCRNGSLRRAGVLDVPLRRRDIVAVAILAAAALTVGRMRGRLVVGGARFKPAGGAVTLRPIVVVITMPAAPVAVVVTIPAPVITTVVTAVITPVVAIIAVIVAPSAAATHTPTVVRPPWVVVVLIAVVVYVVVVI